MYKDSTLAYLFIYGLDLYGLSLIINNMNKLTESYKSICLLLVLTLHLPTLAQSLPRFSYEKINEHIVSLRDLRARKQTLADKRSHEVLLLNLRVVENYGQSLAHYILDSFSKGTIQPYTLNLLHEFFKTKVVIHERIVELKSGILENEVLKALQLESFRKIHDLYFHKKSLRTILNDQFKIESLELDEWYSLRDRVLKERYISNREDFLKVKAFPIKESQRQKSKLLNTWSKSALYVALENNVNWAPLANTGLFWRNIGDGVLTGVGKIAIGASSVFGNAVGNISWREGYLKNNTQLLSVLNETLKPFDLLMEKKAYKFTDITIPGNFGHVGVYMGSEEQLRELGLWELPEMKPFRSPIKEGKRIFQVRRWGLEFDSLENFTNLDEIAVLRVNDFLKRGKKNLSLTIEYLGDQINKNYDFGFDAMTGETVTCTEIFAFSYGPIRWPSDEILGRTTISPDNVAELAFYRGSPLKTIFYVTGDEKGLHHRSEQELGEALQYKYINGLYKKFSQKCRRDMVRSRRSGIRFKYICDDTLTEKVY